MENTNQATVKYEIKGTKTSVDQLIAHAVARSGTITVTQEKKGTNKEILLQIPEAHRDEITDLADALDVQISFI